MLCFSTGYTYIALRLQSPKLHDTLKTKYFLIKHLQSKKLLSQHLPIRIETPNTLPSHQKTLRINTRVTISYIVDAKCF